MTDGNGKPPRPQSDREVAEMIAKFRTPPGFTWLDLANDIETALKSRVAWAIAEPEAYRATESVR